MILERGMMGKMSLRWRLALVIMAAILAAVAFNMGSLLIFDRIYFERGVENELKVHSTVLASQVQAALDFDDSRSAQQIVSAFGTDPHIKAVEIYRADKSLFTSHHDAGYKVRADYHTRQWKEGYVGLEDGRGYLAPVNGAQGQLGWVYIETDRGELTERYRWYAIIIPAALALLTPVAFLLSVAFMRVTARPILELSETARDIAMRKDYSRRAKGGGSHEIGELTDAFNQMLDQIESRDARLATHAAELEKAVKEATVALVQANMRLEGELKERIAISEKLRKTGERLEAALEQAAAATVLKDNFVAMVSHDLKSPLAVIKGLSGGIAEPANADASIIKDRVGRIQRASDGALRLIETLLDVNRFKTGKIIVQKLKINARAFASAQMEAAQGLAEQKNITLENTVPPEAELYADPQLFGRVVGNLLSNAIKFTLPGGVVTISAPQDHPGSITVSDTGVGVDPRMAPKILSGARKSVPGTAGEKGTGLGLFHSLEIVRAHGGSLTFTSEPGKGSAFTATLPGKGTSCILLVDDQPSHRAMMREQFAIATTLPLIEAENGAEALLVLESVRPALIVTDLMMPVMDGVELIGRLRQSAEWSSIPVVVATSTSGMEDDKAALEEKERLRALGVEHRLQKPVIASEITELLAKILDPAAAGKPAG